MDEVIADTLQLCVDRYNADFNRQLSLEHFQGCHIWDVIDAEHQTHVQGYFQSEHFFASIGVMEGSQEVVRDLMDKYEVFIATAAMDVPKSFAAKFEWLAQYFPFIPTSHIVFCGDKSIIAADYLIDDNVRQLTSFRGEGILFTAPHNLKETRFRRVNDWCQVRDLFLSTSAVESNPRLDHAIRS